MVDRDAPQPPHSETFDRYEYFREMPLDELRGHLDQLRDQFAEVTGHYTGPLGRFRRTVRDEDQLALVGLIEDLLPMTHNREAQTELQHYIGVEADESFEGTAYKGITDLSFDVMRFLGEYPDTGVTIVNGGSAGFFD